MEGEEQPSDRQGGAVDRDPLDDVETGETVEISREQRWSVWNGAPDEFFGLDRELDGHEVSDVRIEGEEGSEEIVFEFSGEVKKVEPPEISDGHTSRTQPGQSRLARVVGALLPIGIAGAIGYFVADMLPTFTVSTSPSQTAVDPMNIAVTMMVMALLIVLVLWGLSGGLPGRVKA